MSKTFFYSFIFLFSSFSIFSQDSITIKILDFETNLGIPFSYITNNKTWGFQSDSNGIINYNFNKSNIDTIEIGAYGYSHINILTKNLTKDTSIYLQSNFIELSEFEVQGDKRSRKFRNRIRYVGKLNSKIEGNRGLYGNSQIASFIKNKKNKNMNVLKLGVHFDNVDTNSYLYVKFYSAKNKAPDTLLYKKSFYFSDTIISGWNFIKLDSNFEVPPEGMYMVVCNIQTLDRSRIKEATKVSVLWYRFSKYPLLLNKKGNWYPIRSYDEHRIKYHIKYFYK